MMKRFSRQITYWLVKKEVIPKADYEIYEFGIFQLVMNVIDIISILVLALSFDEILPTICFVISFVSLRKYAGGYHASTISRCYFITITVTLLCIFCIKYVVLPSSVMLGIGLVVNTIIVLFAPVQNRNKELDDVECVIYRRKALLIWGMECAVMLILKLCSLEKCFEGIWIGQCYIALSMCIEMIGKKRKKGE